MTDRISTPRNQRSRATRSAILDGAWSLLEEQGGAGVTMSAVAEAAGISRRGLYLHFTSRGQLFTELLDHLNERLHLDDSLRPVLQAPDAPAALDAWARHVASYHSRLVGIVRAVDRARHSDPDAAVLWEQAMRAWNDACLMVTSRLSDEGQLTAPWTPETAADLLWALMSVELVDDLVNERAWTIDQLAHRLAILMRRTLTGDQHVQ